MRIVLLSAALAALAACSVNVEGAPCHSDDHCPRGQWCDTGSCRIGSNPAGTGGSQNCLDHDGDGYGEGPDCKSPDCDDDDPSLGASGTRSCYTGPQQTRGQGQCQDGSQTCSNGTWGDCIGEVLPTDKEVCGDSLDNDCNGAVDEAIACALDVYVCTTCPGASDTNPGSQVYPLKTITRGIAQAQVLSRNVVHVANEGPHTAATYSEDITIVEGVSLVGRWNPNTLPWSESTVRTIIQNQSPSGLQIPSGVTRATTLKGFEVRGSGAREPGGASVGITLLDASPTLVDMAIIGTPPSAAAPDVSIGLNVGGAFDTTAPLLSGTKDAPIVITGGKALKTAVGISVSYARIEATFAEISGGVAGNLAAGVWLMSAKGSTLSGCTVKGGTAAECTAASATGDVAGIVLEKGSFVGCELGGATVPGMGVGIAFDNCTLSSLQVPAIRENSLLSGGVGSTRAPLGNLSLMAGVSATRGCPVEITGNASIRSGVAAEGEKLGSAAGVNCSFRSPHGDGADSACVIQDNDEILGGDATADSAFGIRCEGSCQSSDLLCTGSCATIARNKSIVASGKSLAHVSVSFSSPVITRNVMGLGSPNACGETAVGLLSDGSAPTVTNNFTSSGFCPNQVAYLQLNRRRAGDLQFANPNLHSNTLVVPGGAGTKNASVVRLDVPKDSTGTPTEAVPALELGSFRNNIFARGPAMAGAVFAELHPSCDPRNLENNNFFDAPANNSALYLNEGTTTLTTAMQINMSVSGSMQNIAQDPQFVAPGQDLHLQATSPLRGNGTALFAPPIDIDGDVRPNPAGTKPDIGADEAAN